MASDKFSGDGQPGQKNRGRHARQPGAGAKEPAKGARRIPPQPRDAPKGPHQAQGQTAQRRRPPDTQRDARAQSGKNGQAAARQQVKDYSRHTAAVAYQKKGTKAKQGQKQALPAKKKMDVWKKALIIVASAFLGLVLVLGGLALWYISSLDANMQGDEQTKNTLSGALDTVPYSEGTYTLVLASDSRAGTAFSDAAGYEDGAGRSDVILLVRTDPVTKTITLVSVPRDTPVTIEGQKSKINEAYRLGGAAAEIQAVEDIAGVSISHYVQVDFAGLEKFIDTLGGIVVDVPMDMQGADAVTGEPVTLYAGSGQRLGGSEALLLARTRQGYGTDQDENRQFGVRELATAMIKEITSKSPLELPGLISELSTCIVSDVSTADMATLASSFAAGGTKIYSATGPSKGGVDPETGMWLCYENPEGWKKLVSVVESGQDPGGVDVNGTAIVPPQPPE